MVSEATAADVERDHALRDSEQLFRMVADNAPVMMWVTDPVGICLYLNQRWYEFTEQADSAGEGYGWLDAVHPDDRAIAEQVVLSANVEQRDYRVEFRLRRADGVYRWTPPRRASAKTANTWDMSARSSISTSAASGRRCYALRRRAPKRWQPSNRRSSASSPKASSSPTSAGRIALVNDAATRIHGVSQLHVAPDLYSDTYHLLTLDGEPYPPQQLPLTRAVVNGEHVPDAR